MSVVLRWYTDGQPDDNVPYPYLTDDNGDPMEFPDEDSAIEWVGSALIYREGDRCTQGWRAVPRA